LNIEKYLVEVIDYNRNISDQTKAPKPKEGVGKKIYEPTGDNINSSPKSDTFLLLPYGDPA
jgi:hypothetical protein